MCWQALRAAVKTEKDVRVCKVAADTIEKLVAQAPSLAAEGTECLRDVLFRSRSPMVKWEATRAIGRIMDTASTLASDGIPPLAIALTSQSMWMQIAALKSLSKLVRAAPAEAGEVVRYVEGALREGSELVRQEAADAMGVILYRARPS